MSRYLKLAAALFRYSLTRELMFKANFILWILVELAWFGIQLSLVEVIFAHVREIAGWNKYEMILLIGVSHAIQQLFQFIFMVNCIELPDNVRTGRLDFALLQPANSQFLVSVRKFDPGALINSSIGLAFAAYAVWNLNLRPTVFQLALFAALILNGIMIHYALMLMIVTLSFWIVRAQGLVYGYYNLFQITRIPKDAFKGAVKLFFTFGLPMLIVANYPAEALARGLRWDDILWATALTIAMLFLASRWFRFGLRFYTSASS
ncbi:MAG: ABC-2 family transporter protein [Verrucomicrobia bacterium]|nr:ABC-2 family transporter protein [Verrucomicrobiota bacterium]